MLLKRSLFTTIAVLSLVAAPKVSIAAPKALTQSAPISAPVAQSTSIASILPAETLGVILINTQNDRWKELSQFKLFPSELAFPGAMLYPFEEGTSFAKDIKPWLGDQVGLALLSAKNVVMVSSVKDQSALSRYVDRIKASRTKAPKEIQYKGATILEFEPEKPIKDIPAKTSKKPEPSKPQFFQVPKLTIAVLPGYFVRLNSIEALKEMLDTSGTLAENPKFQRTMQNPKAARSLAMLYGKYAEAIKAINQIQQARIEDILRNAPNAATLPNLAIDPTSLNPLARFYDTAEGYIWAEPTGLRTQFAVNLKQPIPANLLTPITTRNQILERLPEVNYAATNSQDLALYWRVLTLGLESQPTWKKYLEQARQSMRSTFGVDDRDIFPWMNGEYTVFAYPTTKGFIPATSPNLDIALGVMVQTSDRTAAETALKKFTAFVTPRLGKPLVQQSTIAGQPFTNYGAVNNGRSLNFLSHGWTDQNTLLMLFGGGSISEFNPKPMRNLTQSANFKAAIEPFPDANLGYFYVNQGALMTFVNNGLLPTFGGRSLQGNPFVTSVQDSLGSIRSISGASTITNEQVQFDSFLSLAPRLKR